MNENFDINLKINVSNSKENMNDLVNDIRDLLRRREIILRDENLAIKERKNYCDKKERGYIFKVYNDINIYNSIFYTLNNIVFLRNFIDYLDKETLAKLDANQIFSTSYSYKESYNRKGKRFLYNKEKNILLPIASLHISFGNGEDEKYYYLNNYNLNDDFKFIFIDKNLIEKNYKDFTEEDLKNLNNLLFDEYFDFMLNSPNNMEKINMEKISFYPVYKSKEKSLVVKKLNKDYQLEEKNEFEFYDMDTDKFLNDDKGKKYEIMFYYNSIKLCVDNFNNKKYKNKLKSIIKLFLRNICLKVKLSFLDDEKILNNYSKILNYIYKIIIDKKLFQNKSDQNDLKIILDNCINYLLIKNDEVNKYRNYKELLFNNYNILNSNYDFYSDEVKVIRNKIKDKMIELFDYSFNTLYKTDKEKFDFIFYNQTIRQNVRTLFNIDLSVDFDKIREKYLSNKFDFKNDMKNNYILNFYHAKNRIKNGYYNNNNKIDSYKEELFIDDIKIIYNFINNFYKEFDKLLNPFLSKMFSREVLDAMYYLKKEKTIINIFNYLRDSSNNFIAFYTLSPLLEKYGDIEEVKKIVDIFQSYEENRKLKGIFNSSQSHILYKYLQLFITNDNVITRRNNEKLIEEFLFFIKSFIGYIFEFKGEKLKAAKTLIDDSIDKVVKYGYFEYQRKANSITRTIFSNLEEENYFREKVLQALEEKSELVVNTNKIKNLDDFFRQEQFIYYYKGHQFCIELKLFDNIDLTNYPNIAKMIMEIGLK